MQINNKEARWAIRVILLHHRREEAVYNLMVCTKQKINL
jgi:hypothetical protein